MTYISRLSDFGNNLKLEDFSYIYCIDGKNNCYHNIYLVWRDLHFKLNSVRMDEPHVGMLIPNDRYFQLAPLIYFLSFDILQQTQCVFSCKLIWFFFFLLLDSFRRQNYLFKQRMIYVLWAYHTVVLLFVSLGPRSRCCFKNKLCHCCSAFFVNWFDITSDKYKVWKSWTNLRFKVADSS